MNQFQINATQAEALLDVLADHNDGEPVMFTFQDNGDLVVAFNLVTVTIDTNMTTFDIESFNASTKALWDAAYDQGYRDGEEQGITKTANWQMRGNMDLAERTLRTAGEGQVKARLLTGYAKQLLSRTPQMHPSVERTLNLLKGQGWIHDSAKEPNRAVCITAADILKAGLAELGGYN